MNSLYLFEAKNDSRLAKVSLYKNTDNVFFKKLEIPLPSPQFALENGDENAIAELEKNLDDFDSILISLFVPKAKPLNNFDMEPGILSFLGKLFSEKKCVCMYLEIPMLCRSFPIWMLLLESFKYIRTLLNFKKMRPNN